MHLGDASVQVDVQGSENIVITWQRNLGCFVQYSQPLDGFPINLTCLDRMGQSNDYCSKYIHTLYDTPEGVNNEINVVKVGNFHITGLRSV